MLNVRREICAGCGMCTRVCPTGAVSLYAGVAQIDQTKCINCYRCAEACPRGAIVAVATAASSTGSEPVSNAPSIWELKNTLQRMQVEMQTAIRRLKSLEQRGETHRTWRRHGFR